MPPGRYSVTAEATGFKKETQQNIDLLSNSSTRIDVAMTTGSVSEEVMVTTAPACSRRIARISAQRWKRNKLPTCLSAPIATSSLF